MLCNSEWCKLNSSPSWHYFLNHDLNHHQNYYPVLHLLVNKFSYHLSGYHHQQRLWFDDIQLRQAILIKLPRKMQVVATKIALLYRGQFTGKRNE